MDMHARGRASAGAEALPDGDANVDGRWPCGERLPRVLLMTPAGVAIDVTHEAGCLLSAAQHATSPLCHDGASCSLDWAQLCRHVGPCAMHAHRAPANGAEDALTVREVQIVAKLREGATNKEIARHLGIQEDTVKKHLQSVYRKLGVHRRALLLLRTSPRPA